MEIGKQIQKRRTASGISQEDLAERLYVTRQTLSNWETGKTYPDINSLLRISDLFHISLDELVKGDIQTMEEAIKQEDIRKFRRESRTLIFLLISLVMSMLVMFLWNESLGRVLGFVCIIPMIIYMYRGDMLQKKYDILTFRDVKAFLEGKRLDELEAKQSNHKQPFGILELIVIIAIAGVLISILIPAFQ